MSIKIFISHRHDDKKIADVFRKHLTFWGIRKKEIFQSSAAGYGADAGPFLTKQLANAVQQSKLVVLVHTFKEADWSYCMWEVGLAEGDASTKVVVIRCCPTEDVPEVFKGRVHVKLERDDIRAFVKQFHKEKNFFPGQPAYKPDLEPEALEDRAKKLYEELIKVVPPGKTEERYRWDFITLELSAKGAKEIAKGNSKQLLSTIKSRSKVTYSFGEALKHFGYDKLEDDMSFDDLITRWKENRRRESGAWIKQLSAEIKRAAENKPAKGNWKKLRSVFYPDWYFYPILNRARVHPDGRMHLDVYFYRIAG
jgi:hypothetical protein